MCLDLEAFKYCPYLFLLLSRFIEIVSRVQSETWHSSRYLRLKTMKHQSSNKLCISTCIYEVFRPKLSTNQPCILISKGITW